MGEPQGTESLFTHQSHMYNLALKMVRFDVRPTINQRPVPFT